MGRRSNNEDAFRVETDYGLLLVADGMGGHEGGEVASRIVADTMVSTFRSTEAIASANEAIEGVRRAVGCACAAVRRVAVGELASMGSTLAAVVTRAEDAIIAHLGDSRVYRVRGGRIEQLTRDHSFIEDLARAGCAAVAAQLPRHYEHMITRCISGDIEDEPEIQRIATRPDDIFILSSDGLHDVVPPGSIAAAVADAESCEDAAEKLVDLAYTSGSRDNITVVVARV